MNTLDALVTERVMGNYAVEDGGAWHMQQTDSGEWENLPHYSTDIAAAWQVVEKLWKTHKLSIAVWHVQPGQVGAFVKETIAGDFVGFTCDASELTVKPTAPFAICIAALRAVGVSQDEIDAAMKDGTA